MSRIPSATVLLLSALAAVLLLLTVLHLYFGVVLLAAFLLALAIYGMHA